MTRILLFLLVVLLACKQQEEVREVPVSVTEPGPKGMLFIIGGSPGEKLIRELTDLSGIRENGYGIILPMSSQNPDSVINLVSLRFREQGLMNVSAMQFSEPGDYSAVRIDSVKKASLIYITGGDQNRFMASVKETALQPAIVSAFHSGALIAGTSAGAAVMGERMITGNERRHPDYALTFGNIEPNNIEIADGVGLISGVIIDQHFVKRSRYNRLISAVLEYPEAMGIGIDDSTAVIVSGDSARVTGDSQVILFRNNSATEIQGDLLGSNDIKLQILLPGDSFRIDR